MSTTVTVNQLASALIASFEGCRLTAYQDTGGVWTIGFGHTQDVAEGMTITQDQADEFLIADSAPLFKAVESITSPLAAAALVSFGYNVGIGKLEIVLAGHDFINSPRHWTDMHGNVLA